MNIFGMHFHSWVSLMKNHKSYFEGVEIHNMVEAYRMCKECNVIQEHHYDSQGGYWNTLDKRKHDIVMSKIKSKVIIKEEET